jgi:hypothetical protein
LLEDLAGNSHALAPDFIRGEDFPAPCLPDRFPHKMIDSCTGTAAPTT